jgi:hypothetical protein
MGFEDKPQLNAHLYDEAGNPLLTQKTMDNSLPVVLASDHGAVPVTFTPANARTGVSSTTLALGNEAGNLTVMRATAYVEPGSEAQRSVSSSSADDAAGGTGARTMRITYFDNAGAGPIEADVTMNGLTDVDTTELDIRFIEKMEVLTAGSGGFNAGIISLHSATAGGGTVIGTIGIGNIHMGDGDNQTLWAHHYVPAGWIVETAVLQAAIQSGGSGTSGRFFLRSAQPLLANSVEHLVDGVLLLPGAFQRLFQFHTKLAGFLRLTCYGIPSVNNTDVAVSFDWSEVPS